MANYNKTPGRIVLSIRIDGTLAAKIRGAAKASDRTMGAIMEEAVTAHIEKMEKKAKKPFKSIKPRKKAA